MHQATVSTLRRHKHDLVLISIEGMKENDWLINYSADFPSSENDLMKLAHHGLIKNGFL